MSSEQSEPKKQEVTPEAENKFYEHALAEFHNDERDPSVWEIVCVESAENLTPLNLKGEMYKKAYDEASKRLYIKLRANALLKGYTLLTWVNRIIWISLLCLVLIGVVAAYLGGAFEIIKNML